MLAADPGSNVNQQSVSCHIKCSVTEREGLCRQQGLEDLPWQGPVPAAQHCPDASAVNSLAWLPPGVHKQQSEKS